MHPQFGTSPALPNPPPASVLQTASQGPGQPASPILAPSLPLSWEWTVLAIQKETRGNQPRKPTPTFPAAPPPCSGQRQESEADGGQTPFTTSEDEISGYEDAAPPPQSLFANQDTDSVFNFAMGRVG